MSAYSSIRYDRRADAVRARTWALIVLIALVATWTEAAGQQSPTGATPPPQRVPAPGPATGAPYAPQAILPGGVVLPLFPPGSPYLDAARIAEPEVYTLTDGRPGRIQSIVNIHNPSIELHRADPSTSTGAAVIAVAGGGHETLNVGTEGGDLVPFFATYGVSTIILRNRLRRDGYDPRTDAVNDMLQAIRLTRAHAEDWGVDPTRIGIIGFSAGAELAAAAAIEYPDFGGRDETADPLAGVSSRPDFVGLVYPGPTPFFRTPDAPIPIDAPPSFLVSAGVGDAIHARWADDYFAAFLRARIPNLEMHVYGNGVHAGGLKDRGGTPFGTWPNRFVDWFRDLGFLDAPGRPTRAAVDVAAHVAEARPAAPQADSSAEPPRLDLVGNRFAPLTWETMTEEQRRVVRAILDGPRNSLGGPFNVMLRSPEVADRVQALGALARFNETLPASLRELAIIMTARHWTAHFEWFAHKRGALAAGLDAEIVDAVAEGRRPSRLSEQERALYDFCRQLLDTGRVDTPAFEAAVGMFGERGVVETVTTVGYYSLVSMFLNVDEYPLPEGVEPELEPLGR